MISERWIQVAIEEAEKSDFIFKNGAKFRLGAIVLHKGKIVGRGHNIKRTHARMNKEFGYTTIHAEAQALMRANCGDQLLVVRLLKNGELGCSKPCAKCMKYIKEQKIKEIFYVDWNGEIVGEKI